jgi:hypothetical protein
MLLIYLDPGSGSFLIQLIIAAIAGLGIAVGANWAKLKRLITKNKKKTEPDDEDNDNEQRPGA